MIKDIQLRLKPEIAYTPLKLQLFVADSIGGIDINRIKDIKIVRRSIDARQRQVMVNLSLQVYIDELPPKNDALTSTCYPDVTDSTSVIIVGAGPAGLFAALKLIELGIKPIILERGKSVDDRRKDMAMISRSGIVDPDSNYCFGEGGAGAFSDGKLYTRSKKRGSVENVLRTLFIHGAPHEVLVDAHPHIGTDRLPEVIKAIRNTIINHGGEVRFSSKVTDFILDGGNNVNGVITANGNKHFGPVILATGHSARDIYRLLQRHHIDIEPKGIAVGVRLEHPQQLIDRIIYHSPNGRGKFLPPAEYSMTTRCGNRGVYSFCMCPGGFIIPSASGPDQQAVNGMSPGNRGTRWANSGIVVEILPEDLNAYDEYGDLKVLKFQEDIERRFFEESAETQNAPAQRMVDFVSGRQSKDLPETSYAPGIHPSRIDKLLPDFVASRLQNGLKEFGLKYKGFLTNDACVIGAETRTSSPVRIVRDPLTLAHITFSGLFPCGEGAGYAGGIVSAAIDGERCAMAAIDYLRSINQI